MRIEVVLLENIRSHVKSTVPFARGFNCLVGALGCGKSSILYAIDFALFGEPITRSFDYLLREGVESGRVTLQFTQNSHTYKLIRGIRRRGKGTSQDTEELKLLENDTVIASMKTDAVQEQLKAITGLDRNLWREIVWVKQERLKELIDATPRDRQTRLDELFGLSDYEIAWNNIVEYRREYEAERKILERDPDVTGMEKLGDEYNKVTSEFTLLEIQLQDCASKLSNAKRALEVSDEKLKKMEDKRLQVEDLKRKEVQLQTSLTHNKETLESTHENLTRRQEAVENLEQRKKALEGQEREYQKKLEQVGFSETMSTEILRYFIEEIEQELSSLRADKETSIRNLTTDEKRIESLSSENRCPLCLQSLGDEYKEQLQQRIQQLNVERKATIETDEKEIDALQLKKNVASEVFANLQALQFRRDDLANRINEERENTKCVSADLEEKRKLGEDYAARLNFIRAEVGRFDLADLESARSSREQAFRQYYAVEADLRTKENQRKTLLDRMDDIKERVDNAQQKLERIEKAGKIIETINSIRDAYRSIQPKLRSEFVKVLRNFVQQVIDSLSGETPLFNVTIDDTYTPYVKSETAIEREAANLSGGERTLLAFAYRLGLGQLIMQSRTGHGLTILLLDEPTESLGREDGSIDRLADAISRFKAIEQIIAVTHSEAFADKAEHVIALEKESGISRVSIGT